MYIFLQRVLLICCIAVTALLFFTTVKQQYAATYTCVHSVPYSSVPNNDYYDQNRNTHYCPDTDYCLMSNDGSTMCQTIEDCTCDKNGTVGGSFSCNGGLVKRSCGSPLICNNYGPKQGGLWPCSQGYWSWSDSKNDCVEGLLGYQTKDICLSAHSQIQCPSGINGTCMQNSATNESLCTAQGDQDRGACTGASNYFCCAPKTSSSNPCSNVKYGNGMYCGGANGAGGTPGTLYDCENGAVSGKPQVCGSSAADCYVNPSGADRCNTSGGGGTTPPQNGQDHSFSDHMDGANCSTGISGWVCQNGYFGKANTVHLYADNTFDKGGKHLYPNAVANLEKGSSISSLCGGTTKHAFNFPASQLIHDGKAHSYYIYAIDLSGNNNNTRLYPNPVSVTCSTAKPSTSPSPSGSAKAISLHLVVSMPGMGLDGGDPTHTTRPVTVELYDATVKNPGTSGTTPVDKATAVLKFDNGSDNNAGYFVSTNPVSFQNVPSGNYQILVKVPQALFVLAVNPLNSTNTHVFALTTDSTFNVPPITLLTGDIATENGGINHLNINDYNTLLSCFGDKADTSSCPVKTAGSGGTNLADLNDDGKVDGIDLNIFLRSFQALRNANAPGCEQFDCQGD